MRKSEGGRIDQLLSLRVREYVILHENYMTVLPNQRQNAVYYTVFCVTTCAELASVDLYF